MAVERKGAIQMVSIRMQERKKKEFIFKNKN